MTDHQKDGRYFAWVRNSSLYMEASLIPQLIIDTEMAKYKINLENKQAKMEIVASRVLEPDEYDLNLDQLIRKYPAPKE